MRTRRNSELGRAGGHSGAGGRGAGPCVAPWARRCASSVFNVSVFARPGLARGGAADAGCSAAGQGRGARLGPGGAVAGGLCTWTVAREQVSGGWRGHPPAGPGGRASWGDGEPGVQVQGATRAPGAPGTLRRVHGARCQAGGFAP